MGRARWLTAVLSASVLTLGLAVPGHAGGGGGGLPGYLPPGQFSCSSSFAFFNTVTPASENVNVGIQHENCINQPKPGFTFPPSGELTILNVSVFTSAPFFSSVQGCYFISPSDFVPSADLSTFTLITTIQDSTPSCGGPFPNSIPAGTVISLQWLGTGPIATNSDSSHFTCTGYTQESQSSNSNNPATVSGTMPGLIVEALSGVPSFMSAGHGDQHVTGIADQTCPPGGPGVRGSGHPPQPAGNYEFNNMQAGTAFETPDFSQQVFVSANTETDTVNPQGGSGTPSPSSGARTNASGTRTNGGPVTTSMTQVRVEVRNFNTFTFEGACYLIPTSAFQTNGITSAKLHVFLDGTQPACPNSFEQQNIPLPLTVDATWSNGGPSAPGRDSGQFSCGGYTTQSTTLSNEATSAATFTLPELFPNQVFVVSDPLQSGISLADSLVHAAGVDPPACQVR